ncbi:MAG: pyrroline-5-carboxylate reductase dimerization domain-containing protein, partial [Acidaminococcaceae bacterium]
LGAKVLHNRSVEMAKKYGVPLVVRSSLNQSEGTVVKEVVEVEESSMEAITAISGCGPGYVFVLIDALADAGVNAGLPRALAIKLAAQTFAGSGQMVLATGLHPAQLRDQVTSPGGTTIAGIHALENHGVRGAMYDAVQAVLARSEKLKGN